MSSDPVVWSAEQKAFPFMNDIPAQPGSLPSLANALRTVPEHRKPRGYQKDDPPYPLVPMLLLLLVAVLCGRRGYESIADWAEMCATAHPDLSYALGCPRDRRRQTPVAVTFFRCVRDICLRPFQEVMQTWLGETMTSLHLTHPSVESTVPDDQMTVDGKTIRGAAGRRERDAGDPTVDLHRFAAYVPALHIVLDQLAADNKGQELTMAKPLLGQLPLRDRVITGDALLTQRDICATILAGAASTSSRSRRISQPSGSFQGAIRNVAAAEFARSLGMKLCFSGLSKPLKATSQVCTCQSARKNGCNTCCPEMQLPKFRPK